MCDASLHIYRRIRTAEHEVSVNKAAGTRVDLIQSVNVPVVSNDQRYSQLISELSGPRQAGIARSFDRGDLADDAHAATARPSTPQPAAAAEPSTPQLARNPPTLPYAAAPVSTAMPLTGPDDVGRRVLVPRSLWPSYACTEHAGAGWEAVVRSASGSTAVVRFCHATTSRGVPYADERLPLSSLQPL